MFGVYNRLRSSWGFAVRDVVDGPDTLAVAAFESGPLQAMELGCIFRHPLTQSN